MSSETSDREGTRVGQSFIALLRGVNLAGKNKLTMGELKGLADALGLAHARTYIASGNLLFSSDRPANVLRAVLEQQLEEQLSKVIRVMLRTDEEMEAIVQANPFAEVPANRVQVFFLNAKPPADIIARARNIQDERIALGEREVFVAYGEKGIGRSRLRIPAAEEGTARNMNTVARLAVLARMGE